MRFQSNFMLTEKQMSSGILSKRNPTGSYLNKLPFSKSSHSLGDIRALYRAICLLLIRLSKDSQGSAPLSILSWNEPCRDNFELIKEFIISRRKKQNLAAKSLQMICCHFLKMFPICYKIILTINRTTYQNCSVCCWGDHNAGYLDRLIRTVQMLIYENNYKYFLIRVVQQFNQ